MSVNARLNRLESELRARGCLMCAEREKRASETEIEEEWLALYFARCAICGSQKTWRDMADSTLEAIVNAPGDIDVRTLSDDELHAIIEG